MENNETERKTSPISLTKYLPLPTDQIKTFEILTDTQIGFLIRLISKYYLGEKSFEEIKSEISNEDIIILPILINIKINIERAEEKYNKKREQNSKNGKKGGAPKGNQNARKKKDNEPPEEQAQEDVESNSTEKKESDDESDCDIQSDTEFTRRLLDKMQNELSVYNTSLFRIFSKTEAIRFLASFSFECGLKKSSVFDNWYTNGILGFLNEVRNTEANKYLKSFEKYVEDYMFESYENMTIDEYQNSLKYYKRISSSAIEEYLKQPKQPNG